MSTSSPSDLAVFVGALVATLIGGIAAVVSTLRAGKRAGHEAEAMERDAARLAELEAKEAASAPPKAGLNERVAELERRLPAQAPDQLATVNEAVLAVRLEHLEGRVATLEGSKLERWDVFVIVAGVLGVIGAVVAMVLGIARWLT